ncbi:uncharacterized protein PgNI_07101, partial [Pyricularia grisea]|uniref:Uncharacterized protein n=1 Tax=Pyricularia grisea TaxID=148305 RepID=A0A6P8B034_PYRGI
PVVPETLPTNFCLSSWEEPGQAGRKVVHDLYRTLRYSCCTVPPLLPYMQSQGKVM